MNLLTTLLSVIMMNSTDPTFKIIEHPEDFEWYFEGIGAVPITKVYLEKDSSFSTEYTYDFGGEKRVGKNTFHKNSSGEYQGTWKTISSNGNCYEGELTLIFNVDGTAKGKWTWKGMNGKWNINLLKKDKMNNDKITFISFLYFKEGGKQNLEEFQEKANPYFKKYGIEILHQYQPISKGQIGDIQNNLEQPDMIQIFTAESMADFQAYLADEEVKKLAEIRNSGLRKMNVSFGSEIQTSDIITASEKNALHGIALVNFKDSLGFDQIIEFNQKGQSSGLFSKYGIHAENFVKIMKSMPAIGELDYQQPELIVIFGVDDASKMKDYIADSDYQKIAPLRDNALKSYLFFMCK